MTGGERPVVVIGGAGFIGSNLAAHLAAAGHRVRIYDDLSRANVDRNLRWLRAVHGAQLEVVIADVRDASALRTALADAQGVFHLAAQTAVTTSLTDPRHDFEINARGTFEVLEALRALPEPPPLVFTSTNKVYGSLPDVALALAGERWRPVDPALDARGIDERRPLQFRTPYGCSKGAAEQYVLDYAHGFGVPAVVLRMSCIYGPHQFGTEDQGWVAHFLIRALEGAPITIYGDGCQVRDVLFVDDLVDALVRAWRAAGELAGRAFNIGGGPASTLSLRELLGAITALHGAPPAVRFEPWRPGDQRYYVSDPSAFARATGWEPRVAPRDGIAVLHRWLVETRGGELAPAPTAPAAPTAAAAAAPSPSAPAHAGEPGAIRA